MILDPNGKEIPKEPKFKITNKLKAMCMAANSNPLHNPERVERLYNILLGFLEVIDATEEETEKGFRYTYDGIEILKINISVVTGESDITLTCMNEINKSYTEDINAKNYTYAVPLAMAVYYLARHPLNDDIVYSYPSLICGYLMWKTGKTVEEIMIKKYNKQRENNG